MTCRRHRSWRGPGACPSCLHDRLLAVATAAAGEGSPQQPPPPSASTDAAVDASLPPPAGGRSDSVKGGRFSLFPNLFRSRRGGARSRWSWISAVFLGRRKKSKRSSRLFSLDEDAGAGAGAPARAVGRGMSPADSDAEGGGSPDGSSESSAGARRRAVRRRWRTAAMAAAAGGRRSFFGLGACLSPVVRVGYESNRGRSGSGVESSGPSRSASVFGANRSRKLVDIGGGHA